jgi:hypothetical protein
MQEIYGTPAAGGGNMPWPEQRGVAGHGRRASGSAPLAAAA